MVHLDRDLDRGVFPPDNNTAGLEAPANITGAYVTRVEIAAAGVIEVTFGNNANLKIDTAVLSVVPTDSEGSVLWSCAGDATLADKWLPPACRP